jgi:replicative DNA helicase
MLTQPQTFTKANLRIPPQDLTAEQAVLGSIMIKPDAINDILDLITASDFYSQKHKIIFKAMVTMHDKHEPIDVVSMTSLLKENGELDHIGGSGYLAELINVVPSASNVAHYADTVRKKSALRKLIDSADKILELGYNERDELDSVFDRAEQLVFNLADFSKKTYVSLKDTLHEAWERFDRLHKSSDSIRGVSSGFKDLDNKLAGFQKSDLIILAARPSMGKTSPALDIARNVAKQNIPVAIFSLEMSSQQLVDRIIAAESHVDSWKLRTGRVSTDEEFSRIRDALDALSRSPVFIDDEPSNNITKMKAVARRLKSEHNLGLIIVDYLQLMVPRRDSDSLVQQVTEISRSLKGLARELDVPVIALSQLNRSVEQRGGRPRLSDLRDSGSIEQDADVVMFIHREQMADGGGRQNTTEILIEKHRNGPTGKIELYFDENRVSFTSIEKADFGGF